MMPSQPPRDEHDEVAAEAATARSCAGLVLMWMGGLALGLILFQQVADIQTLGWDGWNDQGMDGAEFMLLGASLVAVVVLLGVGSRYWVRVGAARKRREARSVMEFQARQRRRAQEEMESDPH